MDSLNIEDRDQRVFAEYTGSFSVTGAVAAFRELDARCRSGSKTRAIMDLSGSAGIPTPATVYFVVSEIGKFWKRPNKVAIILREDQIDSGSLGDLAASNLGINGRGFVDKASAEQWLLGA